MTILPYLQCVKLLYLLNPEVSKSAIERAFKEKLCVKSLHASRFAYGNCNRKKNRNMFPAKDQPSAVEGKRIVRYEADQNGRFGVMRCPPQGQWCGEWLVSRVVNDEGFARALEDLQRPCQHENPSKGGGCGEGSRHLSHL